MSSTTPNLGLYLPNPGDGTSNGQPWGPQVNANFSKIDTKFGETVDVKSMGAVGDGSTDDTTSIKIGRAHV